MSVLAWIVLGLTAGFIGSRLVSRRGDGVLPDTLLGAAGAMAGGWLFFTFGPASVNGLNLLSDFAAVIARWLFCLLITPSVGYELTFQYRQGIGLGKLPEPRSTHQVFRRVGIFGAR